jgi:hypothetical protein
MKIGGRKQHYKEQYKFHSTPNIIRQMKSRRTSWAGQVDRDRPKGST